MPLENRELGTKYLNWLALIETDYITMFIKTWFTFLASIQELLGSGVNSGRSIGDSEILKKYKESLFGNFRVQLVEEFEKNIYKAYLQAKNRTLNSNNFLEHYYEIFYSCNESYNQEFKYTYRGKSTTLTLTVFRNDNRSKNLRIVLKDERRDFRNYFGESIVTGFSLSDEVRNSRIFEKKRVFISKIVASIRQRAQSIVNNDTDLDEKGISFLDICLRDIERKVDEELDIQRVFPLRPDNAIKSLNPDTLEVSNKPQFFVEELTKWFVDFSYKLRNILFHFIIDPLDEDWQKLFMYTYLALKYLTEQNIKLLEKGGAEDDNS